MQKALPIQDSLPRPPDTLEKTLTHEIESSSKQVPFEITAVDASYAFGDGRRAIYVTLKKLDKRVFSETMEKNISVFFIESSEKIDNIDEQKDALVGMKLTANVVAKERIRYIEISKSYTSRTGGFDNETYTDIPAGANLRASRTFEVKILNKNFAGLLGKSETELSAGDLAKLPDSQECLK